MKNLNSLLPAKSVLMLGLLATLGFNLSWNPEQFKVSRAELTTPVGLNAMNEMDLASRRDPADEQELAKADALPKVADGKVGEFDLGPYDASLKGIKLNFSVQDEKVTYFLKAGERCPDCFREKAELKLEKGKIPSSEFLMQMLAADAVEKFKERIKPGEVAASDKPRNKKWIATSQCDEEYESEQTTCQADEFSALVEQCGDEGNVDEEETGRRRRSSDDKKPGMSRETCSNRAKAYFKKFLGKSIIEGLKADPESEQYQAAVDTRDAMMTDLSPRYDEMRKVMAAATAQGVVERARQTYMTSMAQTKNVDIATNKAKSLIASELMGTTGTSLCEAMTETGNCATAMKNPAYRAQLESSSKFRMFSENFETSLKTVLDYNPNESGMSFDMVLSGQVSSTALPTGPVSESIANARLNMIPRNSAQPIEGVGQNPLSIPNSLAAPQGQVWTPSYNQTTGNPIVGGQQQGQFAGSVIPGQSLVNQNGVYNSMAPVQRQGFSGAGGDLLSPAQRQGF